MMRVMRRVARLIAVALALASLTLISAAIDSGDLFMGLSGLTGLAFAAAAWVVAMEPPE